jgi:hypothetical protein
MDPLTQPTAAAEDDATGVVAPTEPAADDRTPADMVKDGIMQAAVAILGDEGTAADKIAKLQPLLEQLDSLMSGTAPAGGAAGAAESDTPVEGKTPPAAESRGAGAHQRAAAGSVQVAEGLAAKVKFYEAKDKARAALEKAGVNPTSVRVDALAALEAGAWPALIKEFGSSSGTQALENQRFTPRSGGNGGGGADDKHKPMKEVDGKAFASMLRSY